jgi:Asp-tRNA(Asn)/Glu-tRNA(Gln) amidotransferase A subunit family amidase
MSGDASGRLRHVARVLNQTSTGPELQGLGDTFELQEATIESIQTALKVGALTCVDLVEMYLKRIATYNGQSCRYPHGLLGDDVELVANSGQLNALLTLNLRPAAREAHGLPQRTARSLTDDVDLDASMPDALETAASLDARLVSTGELAGPLHGVVFAIKDQYDTFDMRTTSAADVDYADDRPPRDANFVSKLRAAGAIILAKANMGEYATGNPRSSFGGVVVNVFDTTRSPQGSSSGSATAVSANLVTCAIGEETGTSIRGPAVYASCVGIAATQELVSRHGMIDSGINTRCGPICRTVVDAAKVLSVIAGYDAKDELTSFQLGRTPHAPYETFCAKPSVANIKPLEGLRIGVMREYMDRRAFSVVDHENIDIIDQAIAQLASLGATVVEPAEGDGGLFTPYLRKYYPQLMNATFLANYTTANDANERDALAEILQLAEHPTNAPNNLSMLTIGGDGQFVGQGRFSLER